MSNYTTEEINAVIRDASDLLNRFEIRLDLIAADLNVANKHLGDGSSLAALIDLDDKLGRIDLKPIIETLRPLVEVN